MLLPGVVALGGWWLYLVRQVPVPASHVDTTGVVGSPLLGWPRWLAGLAGPFLPSTLSRPAAATLLLACLALVAAGTVVGLRGRTLPARTGLLLGGYAAVLNGGLAVQFYSAMRVLAPCAFAGGLALVARGPAGAAGHPRQPAAPGSARLPVR